MSTSIPLSSVKPLPAEVLVDRLDDAELPGQPLGAEAVGHREPRRVVGEHEVVVAELDRGERHLLDRRAAVGPVGVGVQVAAQPRAQLVAARRRAGRRAPSRASPAARVRTPRTASAITSAVLAPMPGSSVSVPASAARGAPRRPAAAGSCAAARAERLDLVGVLAAALEQERDPAQRGDRPAVVRARPTRRLRRSTFFRPHPVDSHCRWSARASGARARACPPQPVPGRRAARPPASRPVHSFVHRLVHRGGRRCVDRAAGRLLGLRADEAPGRSDRRRKGKASVGRVGRGPLLLPAAARRQRPVNRGARFSRAAADALLQVGGRQRHRLGQRLPLQRRSRSRRGRRRRSASLVSRLAIGAVAAIPVGGREHLVAERRRRRSPARPGRAAAPRRRRRRGR